MEAGDTIYYFFVCLMVSLVITHVVATWKIQVQIAGFVLSAALLSCLPQLAIASGLYSLSAYWSPLNFIPYSFASVLVAQNRAYIHEQRTIILGSSIALSVLFAKFEWNYSAGDIFFPGEGYAIPPYTRASLVFAVLAISIIALEARAKSNVIINFMAKYALALYCLHQFLIEPVRALVARLSHNNIVLSYGSLILVILFSYVLASVYLRAYLREEVII
jgi:hypothetical protein